MLKRVDKQILNTRLAKLSIALDEAVYLAEFDSDLWNILKAMQVILEEEYDEFKRDYDL